MIKKWVREWLEIYDEVPVAPTVVEHYDSGPLWKEFVSLRNLVNTIPSQHPNVETVRELTERFNGLFENLTRRVGDLESTASKVANRIYAHEQAFKLLGVEKEKL